MPLTPVPAELEIRWAAAYFDIHSAKLKHFVAWAARFDRAILLARDDEANEILDTIETAFGKSIWLIENRLMLLQRCSGLRAQKTFANQVMKSRPPGDVVAFLAVYISERNEDATSAPRFVNRIASHIQAHEIEDDLKTYLRYRLIDSMPRTREALCGLLRTEEPSALIDYYETFVRVAGALVALRDDFEQRLRGVLGGVLKSLFAVIDDARLRRCYALVTSDYGALDPDPIRDLTAEDELLLGNQASVIGVVSRSLAPSTCDDTNLWLCLAAAVATESDVRLAALPPQSPIWPIVVNFSAITRGNDSSGEAAAEIYKFRLNCRLCRFAIALEKHYSYEVGSEPLRNQSLAIATAITSSYLELDWTATAGEPQKAKQYLSQRYSEAHPSLFFYGIDAARRYGDRLVSDYEALVTAEREFAVGNHEAVVTIIDATPVRSPRVERLLARLRAAALLASANLSEAIEFIVGWALGHLGAIGSMPLSVGATALRDDERRAALAPRLSTPIILELYSRMIADDLDAERDYAYEEFLFAHGVERPTELRKLSEGFDRSALIHYLRYVCVPDVMESSSAFKSTLEVANERFAICVLLADLDPVNTGDYEEEAAAIRRSIKSREALRHADQSKISIDVSALRRWADQNLRDDYSRYVALREANINWEEDLFLSAVAEFSSTGQLPGELLTIPKSETFSLLLSLVNSLLNAFASNSEFGLDSYLSIRIRHGVMSGQLRRPAEAHELLTQRESGTTSYQSNASWLARLGGLSERRLRQVDDALKEFSRDYDRLIDHFNNEIIQIRSADKASGLFVVASSALDIHRLHSELTPDSPFEKCFDRTLDIFWREVGVSLNAVGHYIDQRLKASMTALFLALEARLERIGERAVLSGLFRTVHTAQTDSLQAVERVRDWFTLPKSTSEPEFSLQQAFDAALELVRSFHEHFDPIVEIKCADIALIGALSEFTDIFILLLGNVWQHSHLDRPRITGEVILKPHGLFQAEIINEVASGYEDLTRPMLEESKALMRDGQYKARVSKEGRSGFAKILRLLNRLGAHDDWIEYGYLDARHFSVIFGGTIPIVMP